MSQALIAALQTAARQAADETAAAATRQREAEATLASAVAASDDAAKRRRVLGDALLQAQAAEDASRDRLGQARLQLAGTERAIEAEGDRAAAGNDTAAKAIPRLEDTRALQSQLVRAHERRTAEAEAARVEAEAALVAHDQAEAIRLARVTEELVLAEASRVDALFTSACDGSLCVLGLIQARLETRPKQPWLSSWYTASPHDHFRDAAMVGLVRAESAYATHGPTISRGLKSLAAKVNDLIVCWRQGRGEPEGPDVPASAVPGLEFAANGDIMLCGEVVGRIQHAEAGMRVPPWMLELIGLTKAERHLSQADARGRAEKMLAVPPPPPAPPDAGKIVPLGDDPNDPVEIAA